MDYYVFIMMDLGEAWKSFPRITLIDVMGTCLGGFPSPRSPTDGFQGEETEYTHI